MFDKFHQKYVIPYLNFSNDKKDKSNFHKYFENKYDEMFTDIKISNKSYEILKDFFYKYNYDAIVKAISDKGYEKYKFSYLRIITIEDLQSLKAKENTNSEQLQKLNSSEVKFKPVQWKQFIQCMQDIALENNNEQILEEKLAQLKNKLESKKFNFKHYQELYQKTKRSVFLNSLKKFLFTTRDIEQGVIKSEI